MTLLALGSAARAQRPGAKRLPRAADVRVIDSLRMAYVRLPRYAFDPLATAVALPCSYAHAELANLVPGGAPGALVWDSARHERRPVAVDLVYSQYPADTAKWLTRYGALTRKRLATLRALDARFADPGLKWRLVAQTACKTEAEAQALFHGFVVHYTTDLARMRGYSPGVVLDKNMERVRSVLRDGPVGDSTASFAPILRRHPEWQGRTVVMDWTGSMHALGAELLHWHRQQAQRGLIGELVLFNDGDGNQHAYTRYNPKPVGRAGGFYSVADPADLHDLLETMEACMAAGSGDEPAENNIEALLWAQRRWPGTEPLLMVADNSAGVRDLTLLPSLKRPVAVLLALRGLPIHPDYVQLAWATGGSLHTPTEDVAFGTPGAPLPPDGLVIGGVRYRLLNGAIQRAVSRPPGPALLRPVLPPGS